MPPKVKDIEEAISLLAQTELEEFRIWYESFDAGIWDEQIDQDASQGKLDTFADAALREHQSGKSTLL